LDVVPVNFVLLDRLPTLVKRFLPYCLCWWEITVTASVIVWGRLSFKTVCVRLRCLIKYNNFNLYFSVNYLFLLIGMLSCMFIGYWVC
jgi:hypothetical protein